MNTGISTNDMVKTAEKLEEDARKLREAADILEHNISFEPSVYNGTRAEQLEEFIAKRGGKVTRTEIVKHSGIPHGTIASLLGTGKRFVRDSNDNWHVKKQQPSNHQVMPNGHQNIDQQVSVAV